jgi:DNA gyrase subunit B
MANKNYDASSIAVYEGIKGVRKRPTMYIGHIGKLGVLHLIRETYDNSIDEFLAGHGSKIKVEVDTKKNSITIEDEGRGIPVVSGDPSKYKKEVPEKENMLQKILMTLHAGGKFDNDSYQTSSGLNGVGSTCMNALSEYLEVNVKRDGFEWKQTFSKGEPTSKLVKGKATKKTGTSITFIPDIEVMKEIEVDTEELRDRLKKLAYLNSGLQFVFTVDGKTDKFLFENGLIAFVEDLNDNPLFKKVISFNTYDKDSKITAEVAFSYSKGSADKTLGFTNSIHNTEDGTHVTGFRSGLSRIIMKYIADNSVLTKKDKDLKIEGEDTRTGIVAIVNIKHPDPQFVGQTKQKLSNGDAQSVVQKLMADLEFYMGENPEIAKAICQKVISNAKGRRAAQTARNRAISEAEGSFKSISSISKLADCESNDITKNMLYIVEGDSAAGSTKDGRDKETQAVFALRGKILNTHAASLIPFLDPGSKRYNKEISDLINIIGAGYGESYNHEKRKYGKVKIMTDADVDGAHIEVLLLTFFLEHMRAMIEAGDLYICMPPLYSIKENGETKYLLDDEEYDEYITKRIAKMFKISYEKDGQEKTLKAQSVRGLLKKSRAYVDAVSNLCSVNGWSTDVAESLILCSSYESFSEMKDVMKEMYEETFSVKATKTYLEIKGFYKDNYYDFKITQEDLSELKAISSLMDNVREYEILNVNGEEMYLAEAVVMMNEKATPKSRARMKGLGEMDAEELYETTMDPEVCNEIQVTIEDAEKALKVTEILMGKKSELKRDYMEENKSKVNLDVDVH